MKEDKVQRQRETKLYLFDIPNSQTSYGEVRLAFHYALGLLLHSCCVKQCILVINRCNF